jgi:hypothetical protein
VARAGIHLDIVAGTNCGERLLQPGRGGSAELIDHAADLAAASSVLTHENERRWRIFHERVEQITRPD